MGTTKGGGDGRIKRRAAIGAAVLLAVIGGDNARRNLSAAARADVACAAIRAGMDARLKPETFATLVDDPASLGRDLRAEMEAPCVALAPRLAWWRWNRGATMIVPADAARGARLDAARRSIVERCPAVIQKMFASTNLLGTMTPEQIDGEVAKFCGGMSESLSGVGAASSQPVAVWEWPARLEAIARSVAPEDGAR